MSAPHNKAKNSSANVLIGLGANLGNPVQKFVETLSGLASLVGTPLAVSPLYWSAPLSSPKLERIAQPNYLNCVLRRHSYRSAEEILHQIQAIEGMLGRDRSREIFWGPRQIDIDLLAMGDLCFESHELSLPHPEIPNRDFVLYPLRDVCPSFVHPVLRPTIDEMIYQYHAKGLPQHIFGISSQSLVDGEAGVIGIS